MSDYGRIIRASMNEIHRVLKSDGWATIVFHNTNGEVWQTIHDAALAAGFEFYEASTLDRQQQSHKGYKGRSGKENVAHHDVIFNLRKTGSGGKHDNDGERLDLTHFVEDVLRDPVIAAKGTQGIHAEVMRRLASTKDANYASFADIRQIIEGLQ